MSKKLSIPPRRPLSLEEIPTITATVLKNSTADILDRVAAGEYIAISRHDKRKAIIIPVEDFEAPPSSRSNIVEELLAEYQGMLDDMQKPEQKAAALRAFNATPEELGEAAVRGAQRQARLKR